jgi:hypothetical protein
MWLRNILGRLRSGPNAPLDLALTVEPRLGSLSWMEWVRWAKACIQTGNLFTLIHWNRKESS